MDNQTKSKTTKCVDCEEESTCYKFAAFYFDDGTVAINMDTYNRITGCGRGTPRQDININSCEDK